MDLNANPQAFISHASEDKERFVLRFAERLMSKGIRAWVDTWEMLPGDKLVDRVFNSGLKEADVVIVVLSAFSIHKPWVQKELDIAIVKQIEEKVLLIPVRLDGCEVPECLRDTVWQNIPDLEHYDDEFERIVNRIYGQYERPPLGPTPAYVQPEALAIGDLARIDSKILEHACRIAIGQGHADLISGDQLVSDMSQYGISATQVMESQEVLEGRFYVELYRVLGPPQVYDFRITTFGFEAFARVGMPNYSWTCPLG